MLTYICRRIAASEWHSAVYDILKAILFAGYVMLLFCCGGRAHAVALGFLAIIIGAGVFAAAPEAQAQLAWKKAQAQSRQVWTNYQNPRFGFTLSYPSSVFTPQPPPESGDGQTFLTNDGRAKVVVYATANDERFSPQDYRTTILKDFGGYEHMDYSPTGKTWFVLSGYRGDTIYYQKVMFSCGNRVITALSVTFPRTEKPLYEGLIEVMEDRFRPGSGEGCR